MTDHPILFSEPMVQALLAGRKTQTRRLLKQQGGTFMNRTVFPNGKTIGWMTDVPHKHGRETAIIPHQIGDRLWVKEAHWALGHWRETGELKKNGKPKWAFVMALNEPVQFSQPDHSKSFPRDTTFGWYKRNSLFMCKADSRTTLLVSDVRAQRLQDISESDAVDEGAFWENHTDQSLTGWKYAASDQGHVPPSAAFKSLINSINGPDTWAQNPWVSATTFEVVKGNIDKV